MDVVREPIKLNRIDIKEFINDLKEQMGGQIHYPKNLKLINVRGCNGSGKSTIPLQMLMNDRGTFILTFEGKDRAMVFPSYRYVVMGKYFTKTGGLDGFKNNNETKQVLDLLLELPFNILMEGIISSTIFSTYAEWFKEIEEAEDSIGRKVGILNLLPPFETSLERLKKRSPEKFESIKVDQIESKRRTVERNAKKFKDEGLKSWKADNSGIELEETLDWFFKEVKKNI